MLKFGMALPLIEGRVIFLHQLDDREISMAEGKKKEG
jgi:hypothetical protein